MELEFEPEVSSGWSYDFTQVVEEEKIHKIVNSYQIMYKMDKRGLISDKSAYAYHKDFVSRVISLNPEDYLKNVARDHSQHISVNQSVVGGMPSISGTRIPISLVLACLRDGMSISEICEDYGLNGDQVKASIEYSIDVLNRPYHEE